MFEWVYVWLATVMVAIILNKYILNTAWLLQKREYDINWFGLALVRKFGRSAISMFWVGLHVLIAILGFAGTLISIQNVSQAIVIVSLAALILEGLGYLRRMIWVGVLKPAFTPASLSLIALNALVTFPLVGGIIFSFWVVGYNALWVLTMLHLTILSTLFISVIGVIILRLYEVTSLIKALRKIRKKQKSKSISQVVFVMGEYGKQTTRSILEHLILSDGASRLWVYKGSGFSLRKILNNYAEADSADIYVMAIDPRPYRKIINIFNYLVPTHLIITGIRDGDNESVQYFNSYLKKLNKQTNVVVNWDSSEVQKIDFPPSMRLNRVGVDSEIVEWKVESYNTLSKGSEIWLQHGSSKYNIFTNIVSKGNIQNLVLAIAMAQKIGITVKQSQRFSQDVQLDASAMRVFEADGTLIVDDSNNVNTGTVYSALDIVQEYKRESIIILGDFNYKHVLGHEDYDKIAHTIARIKPKLVVLIGYNFGEYLAELLVELGLNIYDVLLAKNHNYLSISTRIKKELAESRDKTIVLGGEESSKWINILVQ